MLGDFTLSDVPLGGTLSFVPPTPPVPPNPSAVVVYPWPKITFKVSLFTLQNVYSVEQPDQKLNNITYQLNRASIQIPGISGNLYNGDTFILYGQQALQVKQVYSNYLTVISSE